LNNSSSLDQCFFDLSIGFANELIVHLLHDCLECRLHRLKSRDNKLWRIETDFRSIFFLCCERQTRAVAEFLSGLDDQDPNPDRKPPKVISPTDPCSAWTAKANKRVQFGYGLNNMIDVAHGRGVIRCGQGVSLITKGKRAAWPTT
jgi:hypothetical protein